MVCNPGKTPNPLYTYHGFALHSLNAGRGEGGRGIGLDYWLHLRKHLRSLPLRQLLQFVSPSQQLLKHAYIYQLHRSLPNPNLNLLVPSLFASSFNAGATSDFSSSAEGENALVRESAVKQSHSSTTYQVSNLNIMDNLLAL